MRQRGAVRIVPRNPITVALQEEGAPFAYGVVANISDGGACIWTNAPLEQGQSVALRLSFAKASRPLDAEGVVIWGAAEGRSAAASVRYGLQWAGQTATDRERLARMIATST